MIHLTHYLLWFVLGGRRRESDMSRMQVAVKWEMEKAFVARNPGWAGKMKGAGDEKTCRRVGGATEANLKRGEPTLAGVRVWPAEQDRRHERTPPVHRQHRACTHTRANGAAYFRGQRVTRRSESVVYDHNNEQLRASLSLISTCVVGGHGLWRLSDEGRSEVINVDYQDEDPSRGKGLPWRRSGHDAHSNVSRLGDVRKLASVERQNVDEG